MQQAIECASEGARRPVGSLPDKMARELVSAVDYGQLPVSYSKQTAAAHLYLTGFTATDVVENIDDALAAVRP